MLFFMSVFSGAGGLDIGAIEAGANVIWANDMMKEACQTYRVNIGEHIVCGDINEKMKELDGMNDISLVIGGPPCQGFSVAGKMDANDRRSQLIWSYLSVLAMLRPRAFVMENVKALGTLQKWEGTRNLLIKSMRDLGYSVNFIVLNAKDFDVPQARERIFVIGFQGDASLVPDLQRMVKSYRKPAKTVREVLLTLDRAGTGNNQDVCRAKITLAHHPVLRKTPYAGMIFNGLGRPIRLDSYSATLPASMGGNKTPIIDERELYEGAKPWVDTYFDDLLRHPQAPETTAVPAYLRRLTVAEAALIQTFPRGYQFQGSQSMKYTQIGNAVPCNMAKAVVQMVIDVLQGKKQITYTSKEQQMLFAPEEIYTANVPPVFPPTYERV
jgi:DNA (cytosine-5)-methyltransferase 1